MCCQGGFRCWNPLGRVDFRKFSGFFLGFFFVIGSFFEDVANWLALVVVAASGCVSSKDWRALIFSCRIISYRFYFNLEFKLKS